jgi:hypothetical protein
MEELICILFALYLAVVWIYLAIQMNKWKKQDEEKYKDERQDKRD